MANRCLVLIGLVSMLTGCVLMLTGCVSFPSPKCPVYRSDLEAVKEFSDELYNGYITIDIYRDLIDGRLRMIENRPECHPIDLCNCP